MLLWTVFQSCMHTDICKHHRHVSGFASHRVGYCGPSDATVDSVPILHAREQHYHVPSNVSGCLLPMCPGAVPSDATVDSVPVLHAHKQHFQTLIVWLLQGKQDNIGVLLLRFSNMSHWGHSPQQSLRRNRLLGHLMLRWTVFLSCMHTYSIFRCCYCGQCSQLMCT